MGGNFYPDLVRAPHAAGCTLVRAAKGSHEIWYSPLTCRCFSVPRNTIMVHTANGILRDSGLPKAF